MFDIFGIKARIEAKKQAKEAERKEKEAKRLEAIQEKKKLYQERKAKIEAWLKVYNKEQIAKSAKLDREASERAEEKNSTCPKCGSKNVVHKVVSGHSKIDGEFDTYPVNRCKDCEHEWNVEEPYHYSTDDDFSKYGTISPAYLYRRIDEYYEMKFDPTDIKEEYNSLEEKREKFIEKTSNTYMLKPYKKAPRYMIEVALFEGFTEHYYFEDFLDKRFNYHKDDDKYSYRMTDEMWEVAKKIIGWEGDE